MSPRNAPRRPIVGVRISTAGIQQIDTLAAAELPDLPATRRRSEMIRRLLSEALTARQRKP